MPDALVTFGQFWSNIGESADMIEKPECEAIEDSSLGQELAKGECEVLATV